MHFYLNEPFLGFFYVSTYENGSMLYNSDNYLLVVMASFQMFFARTANQSFLTSLSYAVL